MKESSKNLEPKAPLISVIVPVYNVKQFLERAVKSIINQTYQNLEIILVDDGSTDGSGSLADRLTNLDRRIQVIHQKNQGLSAARNVGIEASKGKFLTFVDSDDEIEPDFLETASKMIKTEKTKLAICSFAEVFGNGEKHNFYAEKAPETLDQAACLTKMLLEQGFTLMACGKLYARELFQEVEFPVGKLYEDVGTTYKTILECDKIAISYAPKYLYYQNQTSIIHQKFASKNLALIELTDQMCDGLEAHFGSNMPAELEYAIKVRRMHARFSILRMLPMGHSHKELKRELIGYLRTHKNDVLDNPVSSKRDKIAMQTLLLGFPVFKMAWKTYENLAKSR